MLSGAFNAILRLHSRPALLKRLGTVDLYSPIRISPSNYYRFPKGPESTTIKGIEYVIPVATILGQISQQLTFNSVPSSGNYKIKFDAVTTADLAFNADATAIQVALRMLSGLQNILVTGNYSTGFNFVFQGFQVATATGQILTSDLDATGTFVQSYTAWSGPIKKGDRIVDGSNVVAIDEVIDMPDLGGVIMGYRCRAD